MYNDVYPSPTGRSTALKKWYNKLWRYMFTCGYTKPHPHPKILSTRYTVIIFFTNIRTQWFWQVINELIYHNTDVIHTTMSNLWRTIYFYTTMRLLTAHKILIGFALVFFAFLGIKELTRENGNMILGIVSMIASIGIGWYFVWILRGGYIKNNK